MSWLHAVHFLDQDRGWVAGSNGTLLRTTDGGLTWSRVAFVAKDDLRDVYFSDELDGWLLAQRDPFKTKSFERSSYLLNTKDGGVTWQPVLLETTDVNTRFSRLVFSDAEHGWVLGETGVLFATTDGGAHWTAQKTGTKYLLLGAAVANNGRAFLVGAGGTIVRSNDSGATWQMPVNLNRVTSPRLNAVSVVGNIAWTVGGSQMFRTIDGGRTWTQASNTTADLLDIKFLDAREGWVVGSQGTVMHTSDGGLHWAVESIQTAAALERLFVLDRNHAWAVGFGGVILKLGATNVAPRLKS